MADGCCPCSNISIMQLFHELKQQFPAVPDRVVSDCIKLNAHDKEACEAVLSKENQAYGSPSGRVCKMAAEGEACRPDTLALDVDDLSLDFDRRLPGRQSLDSLTCRGRPARKRHSGPASAPVTPVVPFPPLVVDMSAQRLRTQAAVEPSLRPEPSRPYTMVNLTLRPPSSDPQPIDISSGAGGLTYSSCSYDPRQGFQSHLQIKIGPGGTGSVMAARTRPSHPPSLRPPAVPLRAATSLPDVATTSDDLFLHHLPPDTKALVCEQARRRDQLSIELARHRERLRRMRQEKLAMEDDLAARLRAAPPPKSPRVRRLREEITQLQKDCDRLDNEVMLKAESRHIIETLPIGETNEEFYKNIYRGQIFPRPAVRHRAAVSEGGEEGGGSGNWTCHVCTFRNHPALNECEQCNMPRIITASETQNIHIHVTHHNVPSSPYRRVVHSWVV